MVVSARTSLDITAQQLPGSEAGQAEALAVEVCLIGVADVNGHSGDAASPAGQSIAGGLGAKRGLLAAGDDRDVIVLVGDGSYLMLNSELVTAVAEGIKLIVVLIQNHGYASIGHLSETVGSQRFGTGYRTYDEVAQNFEGGDVLPVDLAANARSYGLDVVEIEASASAIDDLRAAVDAAKASERSTLIHIASDPLRYAPDGAGWWDVPVAETATWESTRRARDGYVRDRARQRPLLG